MPAPMDQSKRKSKVIRTANESETFEADVTIQVEGLVGSATISPSGRDVALASPDGLAIIDLDSPYSPPRRLSSHGSPWLVVDVQWSPFAARETWVASTANHRCLIWNLHMREDAANGAIEHSLQGHSRAITDINFSAHHPDILATCAVDGYVHSWDLRKPRKPALTFCDWYAGATQVKYNRQDANILASSHDRWLHIWDERKTSRPLKSINAHTSKIYGLDWNRTVASSVVTCSLDKTIKLWDYKVSDEPERIIQTDFPVWRARHTPFGSGLLAMPQSDPGNLYLYDRDRHEGEPAGSATDPVAVFPGHGNHKVKEFLWRVRGGIVDGADQRDFQLVSWGDDNQLRLHQMDPDMLEQVGHAKGAHAPSNLILTRKGAAYKTYRSMDDTAFRERRSATMSSGPRPGSGGDPYRRSALTLGMQSTTNQYRPGSTSWRGPSMRAKANSSKSSDRNLDQLGWMKGITMSKKKRRIFEPPSRKDSRDSTMFGSTFNDHWEEPEALNDEIVRLDNRLPNVQWDNVDMNTLIVDASLKGPWGMNGDMIYLKIKIDVPHNYPKSKAPKFMIEKTALMSAELHKKIESEVNQVAAQFAKKKQNCLEVAFSYLLGETDLSSSTSFFKNVRDLDDELDALADESSSEDEDHDIPAGGSASMSQELTASVEFDRDTALAPLNLGTVPPNPRTCGARWSNDGKLVCFFPSKEEKAKAFFMTSSEQFKEKTKGEPIFAGFGRLQQDSPPPRQRHLDGSSMTDEHSDTEDDDDTSSSSDSENTYMHKISMWYLPNKRFRKTFSGSYSMRSSGGGTGVDTGTGTGTSRRRNARPKNVVSLHDFRDFLPSRRDLAREYAIFGDGPDVCRHNARVAEKYDRPDLAQVWEYAALILRNDVPLELLHPTQHKSSVLVVAKDIVARFRNQRSKNPKKALTGRVKWGHHPLGKDVIRDLLDHYEAMADVQMLAMLSCIFSEAAAEDSRAYAESQLTQPETPLPMKAPSFSLDYFPTDASLWHSNSNLQSHVTSAATTPGTVHTPVRMAGSWGSQDAYWPGDPGSNSYSCGETPPTRTPKDALSEHDATQSLSTSPDTRIFRRTNTSLTQSLASSFPRPFASIASTSPPTRKKPSPGETFLANLTPNVTWGGNTIIGSNSEPNTTRNSISDDEQRRDEEQPLVCTSIYVQTEDQSQFDDDGWLSVPLLELPRAPTYEHYRHTYAELLLMWALPLSRLEILKFNIMKEDFPASNATQPGSLDQESFPDHQSSDNLSHTTLTLTQTGTKSPIVLGKKELLQSIVNSSRGLDVVGLCRVHEMHLEPIKSASAHASSLGGAVGTCERCKRTQMQLNCVYCREPLDAMYVACFGCGCAIHEGCLAEWHSLGEMECPAGDECDCVDQACNGQVESWAVLQGALRQGKMHHQRLSEESFHTANERGDWESVASSSQLPITDNQGKPLSIFGDGQQPLSAARISLGNRLRKSAGGWSSTASLRKKSGSVSSALGRP